jgi:ferredoxin
MKISADRDRCEGHGQCSVVDFDLFPLDDEGLSAVGEGRPVAPGDE